MSVELLVPLAGQVSGDAVAAAVRDVLREWRVSGASETAVEDVDGAWPPLAPAGDIQSTDAAVRVGDLDVVLIGTHHDPDPVLLERFPLGEDADYLLSCTVTTDWRDGPHFLLMVAVAVALSRFGRGVILDEINKYGLGREVPATALAARVMRAAVRPTTLRQLAADLEDWLDPDGGAPETGSGAS